jgi:hypothetical protein
MYTAIFQAARRYDLNKQEHSFAHYLDQFPKEIAPNKLGAKDELLLFMSPYHQASL